MKYLLIFTLLLPTLSLASDLEREKRWAEQTVDAIFDGEAIYLQDGDLEFLAIYTEAADESDLGMIVVHGTGIHPNWDQVVKPIRVEMTNRGWNTLSIQMPILSSDASHEAYYDLYPEVPGRLIAAQQYLIDKGIQKVVIVAHSQGASMSAYHLSRGPHQINAFVAIGQSAHQKPVNINSALALEKISIPVLDLYGSKDLDTVMDTAADRKNRGSKNNPNYQQQMVNSANHFFDGMNDELIEAVDNWLKQHF